MFGLAPTAPTRNRPVEPNQDDIDNTHAHLVNLNAITATIGTLDDADLRQLVDRMLTQTRTRLLAAIQNIVFQRPNFGPPCDDPDCWLEGIPTEERDAFLAHAAALRGEYPNFAEQDVSRPRLRAVD